MKNFLPLLIVLLTTSGFSQQRSEASIINSRLYEPVDILFRVKPTGNPFDIAFGAKFSGPDGTVLSIPGFYNGNGEYIIRFSGVKEGDWTFTTYSSYTRLAGKQGKVTVEENPEAHGAVIVSEEDVQKFSYEDGTSYFALAFELDWLFALDYDNKSDIPRTRQIISDVKSNGFNQVVMNVYAYDVGWEVSDDVPAEYEFGEPGYSVFAGTNESPDFSQLNLDFFRHFDRVIQHLYEQGIVAHIMIYVWNKQVNWPEMYSVDDNRYFDYIIKRYQAYPNILWDVSKEALDYGRCDIPYINERISRIERLDAYDRLVTVHDYEYCSREPDKVDFISIQNWRPDLYSLSQEAYLRHSDKPVMNIEHGGYEEGPYRSFEGNYVDPEVCLIRNYQCVFAGLYSAYYWQNTAWNVVIFDPFKDEQSFDKPRYDYYRHMQELFTRYDFNDLKPYKPKLTTNSRMGPDNLASSGYSLADYEQGRYLYLMPAENLQINVVIPEPEGKKLQATWFNPFTGEYQDGGTTDWWIWKAYRNPWQGKMSILILEAK